MRQMKKIRVSNGIYWLEIPDANLYILCGCPADSVKLLMKSGLILPTEENGVVFETGPNCVLLSDAPFQNKQFSNLSEFPVLQMLYRQGLILPDHPNNTGVKPLLIGSKDQIDAQKQYIFRGNYGLISVEELMEAGLSRKEAEEQMRIKLKFAFGKIRKTKELLDYMTARDKFEEIRNGVFVRRSGFNKYSFHYKDKTVDIDLNLSPAERYEPPYNLSFRQSKREYFSVIHSGEGDGWDINRPCMASVITFQGKIYLIDAGPNILNSTLALGIDPSEIEGIFHTHAHDDHFAGLPALLTGNHRVKYFSTPLVRASVTKKLCALMSISEERFSHYFEVHDLEMDVWNKIGALEVKPVLSPHPIETNIFMFRTFWEDRYYSYGHWSDIASAEILEQMLGDGKSPDDVTRQYYNRIMDSYLTPVDLKKIDIGGGMIHGNAEDFASDESGKIILAHTAAALDNKQKTIGSSAEFGMVDVLIPSNVDYLRKAARNFLEEYFSAAPVDQIDMLLNCPAVSFNAGSVILQKGEIPPYLYLILAGTVERVYPKTNTSVMLSAGGLMGEISIINHSPMPVVCRALSCVEMLRVPAKLFAFFVENNNFFDDINRRLDYRNMLQMSSLFEDALSCPVRDKIARMLETRSYSAGETILGLNETAKKLFIIQKGEAELLFEGKKAGTLGPGQAFGEEVFIYGAAARFSVRATEKTKVAVIPYPDIIQIPIIHWRFLLLWNQRIGNIYEIS